MDEKIVQLIGQEAFDEIERVLEELEKVKRSIVEVNEQANNISSGAGSGIGGGSGSGGNSPAKKIKEQTTALGEYGKLQKEIARMTERLAALETELGNKYAEARTKLQAKTKALMDEAKSQKSAAELAAEARIQEDKNIKANIQTAKRLQREIDRINKAKERERIELEKSNNEYEQMKRVYTEMANEAKKLGAQLFALQKSETASAETIKQARDAWEDANKKALEYNQALKEIEMAVGQSQRNVGNYNGLLVETNHLLRELPNFAISARTGILSISNNLPMFAEQFNKVAKEIDETTGKAKGMRGAFRQLGKTILSWHTLLIVGITLMITYADEISSFISNLFKGRIGISAAESATLKFNKALEEANANIASSVAQLEILQKTLNDTSVSLSEQSRALSQAQEDFPEYIGALDLYHSTQEDINESIERQIALLKMRAEEEARLNAIADIEKDIVKLEGKLDRFYEGKFLTVVEDMFYGISGRLVKRLEEKAELLERGLESQKEEVETLEEMNDKIRTSIKLYEEMINQAYSRTEAKAAERQIEKLEVIINHNNTRISQIKEIIKLKEDELNVRSRIDWDDVAMNNALAESYKYEKGHAKWRDAQLLLLRLQRAKELKDLNKMYLERAISEENFRAKAYEINERYDKMERDLDKDTGRSRSTRLERELKERYDLWKLYMEEVNLLINREIAAQEAEYSKVDLFIDKRVEALEKSYQREKELLTAQREIQLRDHKLAIELAKEALEKKEQARTDEEKQAILDMEAHQQIVKNIRVQFNNEMLALERNYNSKLEDIIRTSTSNEEALKINSANNIRLKLNRARLDELDELNETYRNSNMSYRAYRREQQAINNKFNREVTKQTQDYYNDLIKEVELLLDNDSISKEYKVMLESLLQTITDARDKLRGGLEDKKPITWFSAFFGEETDPEKSVEDMDKYMRDVADKIRDIANELWSFMDAENQRRYQERMEQLDLEAERIERNLKIERDSINTSLMSQEEKTEKLMELEAKREAFEAGIETQRRRAEYEKAKREKEAGIARIMIDTAVAVTKALATGFPQGLVLAGLVGVLGAIQLANASRVKLPKYGFGTENHPGGAAIVGDRGVELVKTPKDGSFLTPDKPVIMDLPKGTKVIPNHKLDEAHKKGLNVDKVHGYYDSKEGYEALYMMFGDKIDELSKAIINKKEVHFHWSDGELRKSIKRGNNRTNYINKLI